ncbi:hypothetical protein [Mycolicibacterium porcinum]|uniref:Transposase n=1 Tax=Mycolicibacterium porcinum TaxID=39693 RepID=A0ABV3VI59_9MYCO
MPDHDLANDEPEVKYFGTGPGRHRRTGDPVAEVYADGPIDRTCPNCGAPPLEYCHHSNGVYRKIPCLQRLSERTR